MVRIVLFLMLLSALALAVAALAVMVRAIDSPRVPTASETLMPRAVRTTAYVLLLILLLGVTSGWLGPA